MIFFFLLALPPGKESTGEVDRRAGLGAQSLLGFKLIFWGQRWDQAAQQVWKGGPFSWALSSLPRALQGAVWGLFLNGPGVLGDREADSTKWTRSHFGL